MSNDYDEAMQFREKVLGPYGFNQTLHDPEAREFLGEYHDMVVKTAWGNVWQREGLSMRERRLVTMAILMARQQTPEFQMHLNAAMHDGMTAAEIRELLIHCAVYLGFQTSVINFGHAWPVVQEHTQKAKTAAAADSSESADSVG